MNFKLECRFYLLSLIFYYFMLIFYSTLFEYITKGHFLNKNDILGVCNSVKANSQKSFVGHPTMKTKVIYTN
jgi:hypothetical protein